MLQQFSVAFRPNEEHGEYLLNQDLDDDGYCPKFNELNRRDKIQFWLMFISMMVKWESTFNTHEKYKEITGKHSRGLLQLGYTTGYGLPCTVLEQSGFT